METTDVAKLPFGALKDFFPPGTSITWEDRTWRSVFQRFVTVCFYTDSCPEGALRSVFYARREDAFNPRNVMSERFMAVIEGRGKLLFEIEKGVIGFVRPKTGELEPILDLSEEDRAAVLQFAEMVRERMRAAAPAMKKAASMKRLKRSLFIATMAFCAAMWFFGNRALWLDWTLLGLAVTCCALYLAMVFSKRVRAVCQGSSTKSEPQEA